MDSRKRKEKKKNEKKTTQINKNKGGIGNLWSMKEGVFDISGWA